MKPARRDALDADVDLPVALHLRTDLEFRAAAGDIELRRIARCRFGGKSAVERQVDVEIARAE